MVMHLPVKQVNESSNLSLTAKRNVVPFGTQRFLKSRRNEW